jgi:hypothetical protein
MEPRSAALLNSVARAEARVSQARPSHEIEVAEPRTNWACISNSPASTGRSHTSNCTVPSALQLKTSAQSALMFM